MSLLQEKVLCRVCFEKEISLVLLPCRHRVLCRYDKLVTNPILYFHNFDLSLDNLHNGQTKKFEKSIRP